MTRQPRQKLLLFDIDGTLLSARGVPRIVMGRVLVNRFVNMNVDHDYDFSGRTDPEIIEYLLSYDNRQGDPELIRSILCEFARELEAEFKRNHKPLLLDGVDKLLPELANMDEVCLGLVTGNIAEGARIKLASVGLERLFPVGGFGDDSKYRDKLPPIAIARAESYYRTKFLKKDIWIIGDTIHDIACAKNNDLRCLAVASGFTDYKVLSAAEPEYLEADMSDVANIIDILINR